MKTAIGMVIYQNLSQDEIDRALFRSFRRRQIVTDCYRKEKGVWEIREAPFVDDWSEADYEFLISCLKHTIATGGLVCGAFLDGTLKGFVSVEGVPIGSTGQYMDLTSLHVSEDMRRKGIGKELFAVAKRFAKEKHARKLYISAHSAVESQEFYRAMGCCEAEEYQAEHVEREPYDCQLECEV